jgi:hypothetical protein
MTVSKAMDAIRMARWDYEAPGTRERNPAFR